jgi:hypothetical protein
MIRGDEGAGVVGWGSCQWAALSVRLPPVSSSEEIVPIACDGRLELAEVSVGCVVLQKLSGIIRLGFPFLGSAPSGLARGGHDGWCEARETVAKP